MPSRRRSENVSLHSSRNLLGTPNRILPAGRWTGVQGDPAWSRRERWSQGLLVVPGRVGISDLAPAVVGNDLDRCRRGGSRAEACTTTRAERSMLPEAQAATGWPGGAPYASSTSPRMYSSLA